MTELDNAIKDFETMQDNIEHGWFWKINCRTPEFMRLTFGVDDD